MTRAKTRLFLTLASVRKIYGTDTYAEPSSFLTDIDPSLLLIDETGSMPTVPERKRHSFFDDDDDAIFLMYGVREEITRAELDALAH